MAEVIEAMDDRWQDLPEEILLEKVLPLVPIPDLCQFRAVCTNWNQRISKPAFQVATTSMTPGYVLRMSVTRVVSPDIPRISDNWEIHDIKTKKIYILHQSFLEQLPFIEEKLTHCYTHYFRSAIAADAGFVCLDYVLPQGYSGDRENAMLVVNPLTHSYQEVPRFPECSGSLFVAMAMIVAEDKRSFELFVFQEGYDSLNRCYVFESLVGEWRRLAGPQTPAYLNPCHILKMGRKLLTIFLRFGPAPNWLSRYEIHIYDIETDEWMHADVKEVLHPDSSRAQSHNYGPPSFWADPQREKELVWSTPQLVTCGGRLFFTAWERDERVVIWDVDLDENSSVFVAESPGEYARELTRLDEPELGSDGEEVDPAAGTCYGAGVYSSWELYRVAANVLAIGTDDGRILFSSLNRSSTAFSLSDRSWVHTPFIWKAKNVFSTKKIGLLGSPMTLTLCPVPEVCRTSSTMPGNTKS